MVSLIEVGWREDDEFCDEFVYFGSDFLDNWWCSMVKWKWGLGFRKLLEGVFLEGYRNF